jgi:pimeloyl-ACP methyl ester carboxylesterase
MLLKTLLNWSLSLCLMFSLAPAYAQVTKDVIDLKTRDGVSLRSLVLIPPSAKAVVIMFVGGNGVLSLYNNGDIGKLAGNFLARSRNLFTDQGLAVVLVDAPSDRARDPFMYKGFRESPEHATDIKAVVAWAREKTKLPIYLLGTSRGTESSAYLAINLKGSDAPDGIVLTSIMLAGDTSVLRQPVESITQPVLLVQHENDACDHCPFAEVQNLKQRLTSSKKVDVLAFTGGISEGPACGARAHHGYNGIEHVVVSKISAWVLAPK